MLERQVKMITGRKLIEEWIRVDCIMKPSFVNKNSKPNQSVSTVKRSKASMSADVSGCGGRSQVKLHALGRYTSHLTRLGVDVREWYRVFSGDSEGAGDNSAGRG